MELVLVVDDNNMRSMITAHDGGDGKALVLDVPLLTLR